MSGFYALACGKEAGPRGSWTEEQERVRDPITQETDYAENRWLHRDTALPTQRLQKYADTDRCNNEYVCVCSKYEQITKQGLQPAMGHGIDTNKANRAANRCRSLLVATHRNRRTGRRCCRTHSGRSTNSASLLETLHRYAMEQKTEKARSEREAPKSVRQHFVLSARDVFFFFALPFYSP